MSQISFSLTRGFLSLELWKYLDFFLPSAKHFSNTVCLILTLSWGTSKKNYCVLVQGAEIETNTNSLQAAVEALVEARGKPHCPRQPCVSLSPLPGHKTFLISIFMSPVCKRTSYVEHRRVFNDRTEKHPWTSSPPANQTLTHHLLP